MRPYTIKPTMVAIQSKKVNQQKTWLIVGEETGLYQATIKYLRSREQEVFCLADFSHLTKELNKISNQDKVVDMLIVNNIKREASLQPLFENIYLISPCMPKDGTARVIFMLSNELCFHQLAQTKVYQKIKQDLKALAIEVHCFESC